MALRRAEGAGEIRALAAQRGAERVRRRGGPAGVPVRVVREIELLLVGTKEREEVDELHSLSLERGVEPRGVALRLRYGVGGGHVRRIERALVRRDEKQEVRAEGLAVFAHEREVPRRGEELAPRHGLRAAVVRQLVGVIEPAVRPEDDAVLRRAAEERERAGIERYQLPAEIEALAGVVRELGEVVRVQRAVPVREGGRAGRGLVCARRRRAVYQQTHGGHKAEREREEQEQPGDQRFFHARTP